MLRRSPFLLLLLLCSCAGQIKEKIHAITLLSPESAGSNHNIEAGGGGEGTAVVELTPDAATVTPTAATQKVIQETRLSVRGGMAAFKRLDVIVESAPWVGLKYQALGDSFTDAQKGNFSLSGVVMAGAMDHSGRGSGTSYSSRKGISVSPDVHYDIKAAYWKTGLLAGYRISPAVLFYGGYFYQAHRFHGSFERKSGGTGSFAGYANADSFSLGAEIAIKRSFVFRFEEAYSITRIPENGARAGQFHFGLQLAANFSFETKGE